MKCRQISQKIIGISAQRARGGADMEGERRGSEGVGEGRERERQRQRERERERERKRKRKREWQ